MNEEDMIFFKVEITIDMEVLPLAMRPRCVKSYMNNFPMSFVHISLIFSFLHSNGRAEILFMGGHVNIGYT